LADAEHAEDAGRRSSRALDASEIEAFLRQSFWAVLALSVDDEPYGVPIIYGYDDDGSFYIANGPGKKLEMMQQNPHVTLTIVELEDYGRKWRSVIVYGRVQMVEGLPEKLHALNTLRKQIPRPAARLSDAAKVAAAKIIRIIPVRMTGKAIGF
jgi:nitroimidazol reductase NimA-like FMN-containing flavoprotein (pyridoxamine 5'-phosphate oxidase superfamily)